MIPGCLIIKFTITQNAQYRNHFHNVLCLSEAKGMDIKMKMVSIVVPIYNVEEYLPKCLDSLVGQTYKNIELILVNDGSTDQSLEIAKWYADRYTQISLISQKNGGLSKARNTGMALAKGEYLGFVDSDDWLELNTIQEIVPVMEQDELDICLFGAKGYLEDGSELKRQEKGDYCYSAECEGVYPGKELFRKLYTKGEFKAQACMYLMKRDFLIDKGLTFKEGIIHEDELFTPFVLYYAEKAGLIKKKYYNRRIRRNSIVTNSRYVEHMKGYGEVFIELTKCPGCQDDNRSIAVSYQNLCIDNLQQSLNYYTLLDRKERKKVKDLEMVLMEMKKRQKISFPLIYYIYLIKNFIFKRGKKKCILYSLVRNS